MEHQRKFARQCQARFLASPPRTASHLPTGLETVRNGRRRANSGNVDQPGVRQEQAPVHSTLFHHQTFIRSRSRLPSGMERISVISQHSATPATPMPYLPTPVAVIPAIRTEHGCMPCLRLISFNSNFHTSHATNYRPRGRAESPCSPARSAAAHPINEPGSGLRRC